MICDRNKFAPLSSGRGPAWSKAPLWGSGGRGFKSRRPDEREKGSPAAPIIKYSKE